MSSYAQVAPGAGGGSLPRDESVDSSRPTINKKKKKASMLNRFKRVASEIGLMNYVEDVDVDNIPPHHTWSIEETVDQMQSDPENGLNEAAAQQRLARDGKNELKGDPGVRWWMILLHHFFDWMQFVLLTAAVLAAAVQDFVDMGVILFIIGLNIVIGFMQEYKSEKTMESLKKLTQSTSQVVRDGSVSEIPSGNIVVGDVVVLKEGDFVPADIRLTYIADTLDIDEAVLTGESVPVQKTTSVVPTLDTPVGDRLNMAFKGTSVVKGKARGIVCSIGMNTQMGGIATMLNDAKKAEPKLQKSLKVMGVAMVIAAASSLVLVMVAAFFWGRFEVFPTGLKTGVSVAIALVPESLLPIMTLTMAYGMGVMAKQNAIVRKLSALENLGNVTNICSDKTGTISCGKMTATDMWVAQENYTVAGTGISPVGNLLDDNGNALQQGRMPPGLMKAIAVCSLCNMASVKRKDADGNVIEVPHSAVSTPAGGKGGKRQRRRGAKSRTIDEGEWVATGMPTEVALQVLAMKVNMHRSSLKNQFPELVREFAFDSTTKKMTTVYTRSNGGAVVLSKGAPERVVPLCHDFIADADGNLEPIDEKFCKKIKKNQEALAKRGLRVLSLAWRELPAGHEISKDRNDIETGLTFLGLVGIYDPPRPEVAEAIATCHKAGISVHMVTGDHHTTAAAIARQVGILQSDEEQETLVMNATEFDKLSDEELKKMKRLPLVIARCSPDTKVKMVKELHNRRKVVAMTGDGVNDAPAIKSADVGVAMGKGGSDVTKQASDIILTDDNFATIVTAITEGRRIFTAIRRFIIHFLTSNVAEGILLVLSVLSGIDMPLNSTQILWLNCVTSTPCAFALGRDRVGDDIMDKRKRKAGEKMFSIEVILDILMYGFLMGGLSLAFFVLLDLFPTNDLIEMAVVNPKNYLRMRQGAAFTSMTFTLILHTYNCRDLRKPFFDDDFYGSSLIHTTVLIGIISTSAVLYIPVVNTHVFHQLPLTGVLWVWILVIVVLFMFLCEFWKGCKRMFFRIKNKVRPEKFDDEPEDDEEWDEEWDEGEGQLQDINIEGAQMLDAGQTGDIDNQMDKSFNPADNVDPFAVDPFAAPSQSTTRNSEKSGLLGDF